MDQIKAIIKLTGQIIGLVTQRKNIIIKIKEKFKEVN